MSQAAITTRTVTDRAELRSVLLRDPIATAYQLGDLDDANSDHGIDPRFPQATSPQRPIQGR